MTALLDHLARRRRRPRQLAALVAVVLAGLAIVATLWVRSRRQTDPCAAASFLVGRCELAGGQRAAGLRRMAAAIDACGSCPASDLPRMQAQLGRLLIEVKGDDGRAIALLQKARARRRDRGRRVVARTRAPLSREGVDGCAVP